MKINCALCENEIPETAYKRVMVAFGQPPKCSKCGARRWTIHDANPRPKAEVDTGDPDVQQIPWAKRYYAHRDGRITKGKDGVPLKRYFHKNLRRVTVWFQDNNRSGAPRTVGRVIGECFCDDYHEDRILVFKDGDRNNLAADNLAFLPKSKTTVALKGAAHYASKLDEAAVREIRFSDMPREAAMEKYGITKTYYYHIRNGLRWKHVTE